MVQFKFQSTKHTIKRHLDIALVTHTFQFSLTFLCLDKNPDRRRLGETTDNIVVSQYTSVS